MLPGMIGEKQPGAAISSIYKWLILFELLPKASVIVKGFDNELLVARLLERIMNSRIIVRNDCINERPRLASTIR